MQNLDPLGCSKDHQEIIDKLSKIARTDAEVLITGPSGVGKELFARFVHSNSHRNRGPFVPVNCGTLTSELMDNELFGHIGGAFTGARPSSDGLVAAAENGTLFLDEVDTLSIPCQVKLLRFLQDKQFRRLGENRLREANVRIISATNTNLETAVTENLFRRDLFFRLRVAPVQIPPLHQRMDDLLLLIDNFTEKCAKKYGLAQIHFSEGALNRMRNYSWPGNIRELENCVCFLTCMQLGRPVEVNDLPLLKDGTNESETFETIRIDASSFKSAKQNLVSNFEQQYLINALKQTNGNVSAAARLSEKDRRAFLELLHKHAIDPSHYRSAAPISKLVIDLKKDAS
jgi:two-component system, NtrC family, response regulator GlrR